MDEIKKMFDEAFECNFEYETTKPTETSTNTDWDYPAFKKVLELLNESNEKEDNLYDEFGIDMNQLVTPLWVVLGIMFNKAFGIEKRKMIFKYLINQDFDKGRKIFYEIDGKEVDISTPLNLWDNVNPNKSEM